MQKTYHSQTAKFLAVIAQNMPEVSADVMQGWIENPKALKKVLANALCPPEQSHKWREQDGVIYFSVTSDGTTSEEWIVRLEKKGFLIGKYDKSVLRSSNFKPTSGVTTEVAILKGILFKDDDRITSNIHTEADRRGFAKPNTEVACLIREKFTDEEIKAMGLWWIVVMYEPIKDHAGDPRLLGVDRRDVGRWLHAYCGGPGDGWNRGDGFAFVVSQQPPDDFFTRSFLLHVGP